MLDILVKVVIEEMLENEIWVILKQVIAEVFLTLHILYVVLECCFNLFNSLCGVESPKVNVILTLSSFTHTLDPGHSMKVQTLYYRLHFLVKN